MYIIITNNFITLLCLYSMPGEYTGATTDDAVIEEVGEGELMPSQLLESGEVVRHPHLLIDK